MNIFQAFRTHGYGVAAALAISVGASVAIAPAAEAGTVIISSGGVAIGAPGFFLSIGQPIVVHPPLYNCYPATVHFPTYPVYPHPYTFRRHIYRVRVNRQPVTFPNGLTLSEDNPTGVSSLAPVSAIGTAYPTNSADSVTAPGTAAFDLPPVSPAVISQFTDNPYPWLETANLSTTATATPEAVPPTTSSTPRSDSFILQSPSPFNQSVGTLQNQN